MKRLRFCIFTSLLLLQAFSTSWALQLSVNQPRYVPNEELVLTLIEDWAGEADVFVAVSLPGFDDVYFLTPPQNFVLDFLPYTQNALASGSHELLRMPLPLGLPVGEYMVFAAAIDSLGFFDMLGETQTSFIYALEAEPVALVLGDIRFPDGVIGRRYSLAIEPESGTPPYQFSVTSGSLPGGLILDTNTGLIQGEPSARGFAEFTVQVVDGQGNMGEIPGAIKVYGVLTFGAQGTYQGCNGLQMAFNASQDLDEIRIQQGTYECNGLEIPSNKEWENGIKISGGWDGSFENQSDDPALTVFDGGAKIIADVLDRDKCGEIGGKWYRDPHRCFQEELPYNERILTVSAGPVSIEKLSFQNGYTSSHAGAIDVTYMTEVTLNNCNFTANSGGGQGGAVNGSVVITNCVFTNNASPEGGAVFRPKLVVNSIFTNNYALYEGRGGAVSGISDTTIINSRFNNNRASWDGGAVDGPGLIKNSTFTHNSAGYNGGAVSRSGTITNSTFINNSATNGDGGAISSGGSIIINSIFVNNSAVRDGGALSNPGTVITSIFSNNSASNGGAIYTEIGQYGDTIVANCTFTNNRASQSGGAFFLTREGDGIIVNTIFAQNKLGEEANDIVSEGQLNIDYSLVNYTSGTMDFGTHNIMGDPQFVDITNGDFHLLPNSPALDVGDSTVINACSDYTNCDNSCMNQCDDRNSDECQQRCCSCRQYTYPFLRDDNGNVIDLDGNPRVVGGAIDLGAFERQ